MGRIGLCVFCLLKFSVAVTCILNKLESMLFCVRVNIVSGGNVGKYCGGETILLPRGFNISGAGERPRRPRPPFRRLWMCRSYATKVFYAVTVAGDEVSTLSNIVEPGDEVVAVRLERRGLAACRCRAQRHWRLLVRGSSSAVSARLTDIEQAVHRAWYSTLQSVGKHPSRFFLTSG